MKHQKPLAVRIFIRICVFFMAISLIGAYVVYMFTPQQEAGESENEGVDTGVVEEQQEENSDGNEEVLVIPEINPEEPNNSVAPILVTEDGETDEMDQTIEVQLENGGTETIRQGDLSDVIQID